MKDENALAAIAAVVSVGVFIIGTGVGISTGRTEIKEQSIRAGVAYYTNDASGKPQFKWKEAK